MLERQPVPPLVAKPEQGRSYPLWLWLALSALVIVLDQLSKYAITTHFAFNEALTVTPFFDLVRAHNPGAAFGFLNAAGGWQRWLFTAISVGASVLIVALLPRHLKEKLFCLALALILGGALGNLIDRVAYGFVVDFLDFHWDGYHFAAFNLADSAITGGAGLLLLDSFLKTRRERAARTASTGE